MLRASVLALFVLGLSGGVARPGAKDDPVPKDLANLKGSWISTPVKEGDKKHRRVLRLGKDDFLLVVRQPGGPEPFKELIKLDSIIQKDKKLYLSFVGALIPNEYRVEYELTGDKLTLKGSAGGIDLSGEWTRHKENKKEVNAPRKENPPGTSRALLPEKADPIAERIADQLTAYEILAGSFLHAGNRGTGKGVKDFAIVRISRSAEPIELQYARCLSISQDGNVDLERPTFKGLVKSTINLSSAVLKEGLKEPKYAAALVRSRVLALAAENKDDNRKAFDAWEIRYHNALTAEDAAKFLRAAAMVDSVTTKEHRETRKLFRDQVLKVLADDPETLKTFAQAPQASEELQKSRNRVKALIEDARKK